MPRIAATISARRSIVARFGSGMSMRLASTPRPSLMHTPGMRTMPETEKAALWARPFGKRSWETGDWVAPAARQPWRAFMRGFFLLMT